MRFLFLGCRKDRNEAQQLETGINREIKHIGIFNRDMAYMKLSKLRLFAKLLQTLLCFRIISNSNRFVCFFKVQSKIRVFSSHPITIPPFSWHPNVYRNVRYFVAWAWMLHTCCYAHCNLRSPNPCSQNGLSISPAIRNLQVRSMSLTHKQLLLIQQFLNLGQLNRYFGLSVTAIRAAHALFVFTVMSYSL